MEYKIRQRNPTGLSLHPEEARIVANVIAYWTLLEHLWTEFLASFMGHGYSVIIARNILGALQNSKAKLDVVADVGAFVLKTSAHAQVFGELMDRSRKMLACRNRYAHGAFGSDEKGRLILMNLEFDPVAWVLEHPDLDISRCQEDRVPVTARELQDNFDALIKVYGDLFQFSQILLPELAQVSPWQYRYGPEYRLVASGPASTRPPELGGSIPRPPPSE